MFFFLSSVNLISVLKIKYRYRINDYYCKLIFTTLQHKKTIYIRLLHLIKGINLF